MRPSPSRIDPAADAAALLRRIGFATLVVAVPVAALVARRATVVLVPLGTALLMLAALLDGANPPVWPRARAILTSYGGLALLLLAGWTGLSILWSPFAGTADEKFVNMVGVVLLAAAGAAALPERMRASNLYLTGIGVAAAALFACALALTEVHDGGDIEGSSLERGLVSLVMVFWPALAWLVSRDRGMLALGLTVAVGIAILLGPSPAPALALIVGGLFFAITTIRRETGVKAAAGTLAGLVLAAPLLPFLLRPVAKLLFGSLHPATLALRAWTDVTRSEPLRLITGHGLDTSLRGKLIGMLPIDAPASLLFEIWYELGLVGAAATAAVLYWSVQAAGRAHAPLVPGAMAAFAGAFTFACLGVGVAQTWWLTTLGIVVVAFVAIERGQYRTTRPKAQVGAAQAGAAPAGQAQAQAKTQAGRP